MIQHGVREPPSERDCMALLRVTPNATPGKLRLGAAVVLPEVS